MLTAQIHQRGKPFTIPGQTGNPADFLIRRPQFTTGSWQGARPGNHRDMPIYVAAMQRTRHHFLTRIAAFAVQIIGIISHFSSMVFSPQSEGQARAA